MKVGKFRSQTSIIVTLSFTDYRKATDLQTKINAMEYKRGGQAG